MCKKDILIFPFPSHFVQNTKNVNLDLSELLCAVVSCNNDIDVIATTTNTNTLSAELLFQAPRKFQANFTLHVWIFLEHVVCKHDL